MKNFFKLGFTLFFTLAFYAHLSAQCAEGTLYAISGAGGAASNLYTVDANTGVFTLVGATGFSHMTGLAADPATGDLYGVVSNNTGSQLLISIDPGTGIGTSIGSTGLQIPDIAFNSAGVLYGWAENIDDLVTIDLGTGATTVVGDCACTTGVTGLAFDSADNLYLKSQSDLHEIDAALGTILSTTALSGGTSPYANMLAFDDSDQLYTGSRSGGVFTLETIDIGTGTVSDVGTDPASDISAIAFCILAPSCPDPDGDGVCTDDDNCPMTANAGQEDGDGDGQGDVCDACPNDANNDIDGDGVCGDVDNCPTTANAGQEDGDGDGQGDVCDACPNDANNDIDGDGVCGDVDNCPTTANAGQEDGDGDGQGDVCDACPNDANNDIDGDGICGDIDNCPNTANPDQADGDGDGIGDACDDDYCPSYGTDTSYEWIKKVALGTINNVSGNDGGYGDYTHLSTDLNLGTMSTLKLKPGFSGNSFQEYWCVWIDFNQDGDFDDDGELIFYCVSNGNSTIIEDIFIPYDAVPGETRVRISMRYDDWAYPCDIFTYGEVEDYTVNLVGAPCGDLPGGWSNKDVGYPPYPGAACYDDVNETFTVHSFGYDLYGCHDEFHYVYQEFCGDGEIIAEVTSITNSGAYALAGLMFRKSTSKGSKYAGMLVTAEEGTVFQSRYHHNGSTSVNYDTGAAPIWLKVERSGDVFTGYHSSDGVNWTASCYSTVNMPECITVGLAVSNYAYDEVNTSVFESVEVNAVSSAKGDAENRSLVDGIKELVECDRNIGSRWEHEDCEESLENPGVERAESNADFGPFDFNYFPNPAGNYVNIEPTAYIDGHCSIQIHNNLGQLVFERKFNDMYATPVEIDLQGLESGVYFISLSTSEKDTVKTRKLIIEN